LQTTEADGATKGEYSGCKHTIPINSEAEKSKEEITTPKTVQTSKQTTYIGR
jgi:hypothetical protein